MKQLAAAIVFLHIVCVAPRCGAQDAGAPARTDTVAVILLTAGGGYAHYVMPYPATRPIDREGYALSIRLSLHPGRRLRLGLESGWTTFYSYELDDVQTSFGTTDASLSLSAVPLLVVFSMPIIGSLTVHAGSGGYFVRSRARSFGESVDVVRFAQGWVVAASWDAPFFRSLRFGAEVKWYGATEFGDGALLLQLFVSAPLLHL
jgi:hypothetical protein